jgi:hypothetical protein
MKKNVGRNVMVQTSRGEMKLVATGQLLNYEKLQESAELLVKEWNKLDRSAQDWNRLDTLVEYIENDLAWLKAKKDT